MEATAFEALVDVLSGVVSSLQETAPAAAMKYSNRLRVRMIPFLPNPCRRKASLEM
jgi:hypothetical protein